MADPLQWVCTVCGYVHEGPEPPDVCPVCGAGADAFDPAEEPAADASSPAAGESVRVVIVGASAAGLAAAESARNQNAHAEVILLSAENRLPYYRLNLTRWIAGEIDEGALTVHPESWYREQHIDLRLNTRAASVHADAHTLELTGGESLPYDRLVLAAGAAPFVPPIPGADKSTVMTLRTVDDGRRLIAEAQAGKQFVCIGGGILGLETAGGLAHHGAQITIIERADWLMNRQLEQAAGERLADILRERGMTVKTSANTAAITGREATQAVTLEDGDEYPADYVVITAGIRSRLDLAQTAGLQTERGVKTDAYLRTSHPDIFAAGDICEMNGELYGLWGPAHEQGRIAGINAAGGNTACDPLSRETVVKVLGIDLKNL